MDTITPPPAPQGQAPDLAAMLATLSESQPALMPRKSEHNQDRLVQARLGVASGLFASLRAKHQPTAYHCLRVALGCSAWSLLMDMDAEQRDGLEVAALLHDIGKIGVPDSVLLKPGKLHGEEIDLMERHRVIGQQILASCCVSPEVLEIVHFSGTWYDGSYDADLSGTDLPLGARVLAVVDAFDSMTTDHVYRRALPRERAVAELYEGAGTQFDPELVKEFCDLTDADRVRLDVSVGSRWLQELKPADSTGLWGPGPQMALGGESATSGQQGFYEKLVESMHDAVIYVNTHLQIQHWNQAAERLTGVASSSVLGQQWSPELIELKDEEDRFVTDEACPAALVMSSGVQVLERGSVVDRRGHRRGVNIHVIPVHSEDGVSRGAVILFHDASNQITLEERVQSLHVKATQDPLTKVANRAEFDRVHTEFVATHLDEGMPCSLIICDIDHFKRVNDTFGHQAGDEALTSFASVLQSFTRAGDLVARYGGEEFVLLCADCDHASATRRAEEIRSRVSSLPQPMLKNMCITASFGVTGMQAGDTPETMLARADRALLQAKDSGRNRVVQLGSGIQDVDVAPRRSGWFSSLFDGGVEQCIERTLHTAVPLNVAVEKLRGFVADHRAEITHVEENVVSLSIDARNLPNRRQGDRSVPFIVGIRFREKGREPGTAIEVSIHPKRRRDRRLKDVEARTHHLLGSIRAYFMASDPAEEPA